MQRLPRLAIAALPGLDHFIPALVRGLNRAGAIEARVFPVRGPADLPAVLAWTDQPGQDAIWFEFCWPPFPALIAATDFGHRRVIVRVHRIEAYETNHVARTSWGKVTNLIVVSQDMARCVREARPDIDELTRLHVIHNGVDLDAHPAPLSPIAFDPFRIGWCGAFSARKNPCFALQVLHELRRHDPPLPPAYGDQCRDRLTMEAFCHQAATLRMADLISFDGRLPAHAMPAWHAANGILLSTSLHESFGYAIAEAAAAGCDLAVLDHLGANEFWPEATRFVAVPDAVRLIRDAAPNRWRGHIEASFSLEKQVSSVLALLGAAKRERGGVLMAGSALYWDRRYARGGDSGAGSSGRLAAFKAEVLNQLVVEHDARTVLEFGCGDGRQLALARYPSYVGVDVSPSAIALCRDRYAGDKTKRFLLATDDDDVAPADLVLSLDVVFHLIEDDVFDAHLRAVFGRAGRLVAVYASDREEKTANPHVRHRSISAWIARHAPDWRRIAHIPNPYPFDPACPDETSFADFHIFAPRSQAKI